MQLIDIAFYLGSFIKVIKRLKINILISDYFAFSIRQSVKCLNSNLSLLRKSKIKTLNFKNTILNKTKIEFKKISIQMKKLMKQVFKQFLINI